MKAVRGAEGGVELVNIDEPPGRGELLTMRAVSICGSDFGYIAGGSRFIMGHELAGVRGDGTPVAVEAMYGCMTCVYCLEGAFNLCAKQSEDALGMAADGGMVEQFRAPENRLVPLPPGLDVRDASLVEPASVAWHGLRIGGTGAGKRVGIVGGGAIGQMAVVGARAQGADDVGLEARYDHQREIGERLGASPISGLYDVVVEAAGSASSLARSVELVAPRGSIVVLGVHFQGFTLDFIPLLLKEARIVPSIGYCHHEGGRDMAQAAAMLASHPDVVDSLVTHRFPLEDAAEAFRVAQDRKSGAMKVVIEAS